MSYDLAKVMPYIRYELELYTTSVCNTPVVEDETEYDTLVSWWGSPVIPWSFVLEHYDDAVVWWNLQQPIPNEELHIRLGAVEDQNITDDSRLDGIESDVSALETAEGTQQSEIDALDGKLDALDASFSVSLPSTLSTGTLPNNLTALSILYTPLNNTNTEVEAMKTTINSLISCVNELRTRLNAIN